MFSYCSSYSPALWPETNPFPGLFLFIPHPPFSFITDHGVVEVRVLLEGLSMAESLNMPYCHAQVSWAYPGGNFERLPPQYALLNLTFFSSSTLQRADLFSGWRQRRAILQVSLASRPGGPSAEETGASSWPFSRRGCWQPLDHQWSDASLGGNLPTLNDKAPFSSYPWSCEMYSQFCLWDSTSSRVKWEGWRGDTLEGCRETPGSFFELYIFFGNLHMTESRTSSPVFSLPLLSLSTHLENFRTKECPESLDVLTSYEAKVLPDLLRCFLSCKTKKAVSAGWWLLGWEVSLSDLWCSSFSRFFPGNSGTFLQDVFTHSEWHPGDAEQE